MPVLFEAVPFGLLQLQALYLEIRLARGTQSNCSTRIAQVVFEVGRLVDFQPIWLCLGAPEVKGRGWNPSLRLVLMVRERGLEPPRPKDTRT